MEIKFILFGLGISLLGYLIQARPRFYNRYFGVDTWRNLTISDYIRTHKRLPHELPKYMLKGPFDYPPLFNILLSWLPKKIAEDYQGFISPVFDALHSFIIFIVVYFLSKNLAVAAFAQIVYILTPMAAIENASLNARSFGSLLFTCAFLSTVLYLSKPSPALFMLAVFFTMLVLFSHKMASQTLFFMAVFFSLFERNLIYVLIFGMSIILAILVSGRFYLKIVRGQLAVLKYFRIILKDRYAHQIRGVVSTSLNKDFIEKLKGTIREYPLFALVGSCPLIAVGFLIAFWVLIYPKNSFLINYPWLAGISFKLALWLVILYGLGIITAQFKPFQFLGEGMKYLMYAGLPSVFIISMSAFDLVLNHNNWILLILIIVVLFLNLIQIFLFQDKAIIKDTVRTVTPALKQVMEYLGNQPQEVRLATMPFSLSDVVAYFTKSNILSSDSAYVLANNPDYTDYYPVLRKPLEEILTKHKINFLLIDKNYVTLEELNLARINIALEKQNLCLIKR